MSTVKRFEDLECWKSAGGLCKQETYSLASLTGKQISGLMTYLKNSSRKGFKYP